MRSKNYFSLWGGELWSRGCVREKPVSCAWKLCIEGEKYHPIAWEIWILWDSKILAMSVRAHPAFRYGTKTRRERMEKEIQELTTEETVMCTSEMHSVAVFSGREHTALASLSLSLVPCVYSLGQHGLLSKPLLVLAWPQEQWLLQIWKNNKNSSFIFIFLTFLPDRKGFPQHSNQSAL